MERRKMRIGCGEPGQSPEAKGVLFERSHRLSVCYWVAWAGSVAARWVRIRAATRS